MVPADMVDTCWGQIEPFLAKACKFTYGRYTTEDIYEMLGEGIFHLWVAFDADEKKSTIHGAVVTQFVAYPRSKYLVLTFCGGRKIKNWQTPMLDLLKKFARDMTCDGIEATARLGWAKLFKDDGYKPLAQTFQLPVADAGLGV
jgi:hypothetical protein